MYNILKDLHKPLGDLKRKGGKKSRKQQAKRIELLVLNIAEHEHAVKRINQIGRNHITGFLKRNSDYAFSTKRDYNYAIRYFWNSVLNRNSAPPVFELH